MANERRFETPRALQQKINKYFRMIRREVPMTEPVPTGKLDKYGHPVFESKPVLNELGKQVVYLEYVVPPRMTALRLALKVDAETWSRYASGEVGDDDAQKAEFVRVCADAKAICEDWLKEQKLTRTKGLAGVMHELEVNYGDGVKDSAIARAYAAPMPLEEVEGFLRELGVPGFGNDAPGEGVPGGEE